jgi:alpha-tubulin suppressor-like RCC1 family protein
MPDIAKYSGITMADIAKISGQTVASGGGGGVSESNTGILYFEGGGFNQSLPDAQEYFGDAAVPLYKAQLSTRTDIVEMKPGQYHIYALDSSNNLYSCGHANTANMGRAVSNDAHQFVQTLTSVSKFAPTDQGCWAVKTDGTLWWCGQIGSFADNGDTGTGSVSTPQYQWSQFGSDTDWIDIDCFPTFPVTALAIKGGTGSEYLYSAGQNFWGRTGLGTTSGSAKPWTRVKSDATTDWAETIADISIGYSSSIVVTKSGKLFAFGDAQNGHLGQGDQTDYLYPIQVGTDTDWATCYAKARFAGFAIKTNGTLYSAGHASYYYNIQPSTQDRTYRQIGTDTDYELIRSMERDTAESKYMLWAKKNGTWYVNWGQTLLAGSFIGNTSNKLPATDNTWYTINQFLEGNDVTVSVNYPLMGFRDNNQNLGDVLTIATAAT